MNKSAIQKFAMGARTTLMEQVAQRAYQYGITKDGYGDANAVTVNGKALSTQEQSQRRELVREIQAKGYDQVMEEVAYTWFNRFIALRYMEVNNYLPSHIRVFSNAQGAFDPEILKVAHQIDLPGLDQSKVAEYIEKSETEDLYRYLLLTQCNALNVGLPKMFEKMGGYTELLFPNNVLRPDSVLGHMVSDIPEEDWSDQVQIIGWLYQYYNTELKAETFDLLKKNVKVTKERIPSATQLFTPDWIVRYMVENSLGRLWLEGHPNQALRESWKYYLDEAEQEPEVEAQLAVLRSQRQTLRPEDITLIDPCMGSGHILGYAFDVLMQIYESEGWSQRDAAAAIVQKNLYGLDIDRRAAQLAYFAVMMKARQYDRRFLTRGIQPNLYSPGNYADGQEYGSLLVVDELEPKPEAPEEFNLFDAEYEEQLNAWNFRRLLSQEYDVVVTNPPYMALSNSNATLNKYVKDNYPDSKGDLCSVFIERCRIFRPQYLAMITQHSWMFLKSFEKFRTKLLLSTDLVTMAHLGARAFEEIPGEKVQTTSFILRIGHHERYKGTFVRLVEPTTQQSKEEMFLAGTNRYTVEQDIFFSLPDTAISYWISQKLLSIFKSTPLLKTVCEPKVGLQSGNSEKYFRLWHEVAVCSISFAADLSYKWFPCVKGGEARKWYGNNLSIIDWSDNGSKIKNEPSSVVRNAKYYFHNGLTWTKITSEFALRYFPHNMILTDSSVYVFPKNIEHILGFLNSKVAPQIVTLLNPTLNFVASTIGSIPVIPGGDNSVDEIVNNNIHLSKIDWDSYETSWDFKRHPLV